MHIALVNSFPNLPHTAEVEYISRFRLAAERIGHKAYEVVTSDDIIACAPDFVIATHNLTPKLTPHLTLGAMWNPPHFFQKTEDQVRSVLSYDGYLIGSEPVRRYLDDLELTSGVIKPKSDFHFLPSAPMRRLETVTDRRWDLVYVGVNWDGSRHGALLSALDSTSFLNLYGPEESWTGYARSYRGQTPFDGESIFRVLSRHGIALCLHNQHHRAADTPSARLFEAAAAGCVLIVDEIPFARRVLGDHALYVDLRGPVEETAATVLRHVAWARDNRERATEVAMASRAILLGEYGIERAVERCCDFAARITRERSYAAQHSRAASRVAGPAPGVDRGAPAWPDGAEEPQVDLVLPAFDQSADRVMRTLDMVGSQEGGPYRVLLIDNGDRDELEDLVRAAGALKVQVDYVRSGSSLLRSTPVWAGLTQVRAPFFAVLDKDYTLAPGHLSSLLALAADRPRDDLFYSGLVHVGPRGGPYVQRWNFEGALGKAVPERRSLLSLGSFDIARIAALDEGMATGSWIARRSLLDAQLLEDPRLAADENLCLLLLLASKAGLACSFQPTAFRHVGVTGSESSAQDADNAVRTAALMERLGNVRRRCGQTFRELWDGLAAKQDSIGAGRGTT